MHFFRLQRHIIPLCVFCCHAAISALALVLCWRCNVAINTSNVLRFCVRLFVWLLPWCIGDSRICCATLMSLRSVFHSTEASRCDRPIECATNQNQYLFRKREVVVLVFQLVSLLDRVCDPKSETRFYKSEIYGFLCEFGNEMLIFISGLTLTFFSILV